MGVDEVVLLGRLMLQEVVILIAPILFVAIVVSLMVNIRAGADLASGPDPVSCAAPAGHRRSSFHDDALDVAASGALHAQPLNRLSQGAAVVNISLVQVFGALLTIGVRLTGIMLFAPFFGSVAIPARVKAVLVMALTALLYPMTLRQDTADEYQPVAHDGLQ